MAYADQTAMVNRFGKAEIISLTDPDNLVIDPVVVGRALDDASAEIDTYLCGRYDLPLTAPYPTILERVCCDIARYRLYDDLPIVEVRKRYEDALSWLRDIAAGRAVLLVEPSQEPKFSISVVSSAQVFTDELIGKMF